MSLLLLPGCLGEAFLVARAIKRSGKGPFYNQIEGMLDEHGGPDFYPGRLPRNLELFSEGDDRFKSAARPYAQRGVPSFAFDGVEESRICFLQTQVEDVFRFDEAELARVDRLARDYELALEVHGSLEDPPLRQREVWPTSTYTYLSDAVEVLRVRQGTRDFPKGTQTKHYVAMQLRHCGAIPAELKDSRMLTLAVRSRTESVDPYVLFWVLTDDEGKGTVRDSAAVASKGE